jgi:hypothetical protein
MRIRAVSSFAQLVQLTSCTLLSPIQSFQAAVHVFHSFLRRKLPLPVSVSILAHNTQEKGFPQINLPIIFFTQQKL